MYEKSHDLVILKKLVKDFTVPAQQEFIIWGLSLGRLLNNKTSVVLEFPAPLSRQLNCGIADLCKYTNIWSKFYKCFLTKVCQKYCRGLEGWGVVDTVVQLHRELDIRQWYMSNSFICLSFVFLMIDWTTLWIQIIPTQCLRQVWIDEGDKMSSFYILLYLNILIEYLDGQMVYLDSKIDALITR